MKATVPEIKQLWEKAFNAKFPDMPPYQAFMSAFLHKGQLWIEAELSKLRRDSNEVSDLSMDRRRGCCGGGVSDYHYLGE